jgi:cell division protein FtsA
VNATSALYKHIPLDSKYLVVKNFKGQEPINIDQRTYCRFINACLDQIFTLVKNEIQSNFYKDALNAGIVITGGGAMINDLKNYVEQFTGIHTQIGRPNAYLSNLKDRSLADTMYSTAIGLVLLAAKNANNDMVVTPEEIEKSKVVEVPQIEDFEEEKIVVPVKKVAKKGSGWADRLKSKFDSLLLDENTVKDFEDIR